MKKFQLFLAALFLLFLLPLAGGAHASAAEVSDLRWSARNDGKPPFVRVVLDLTGSVKAVAALSDDGSNLEVVLKNTSAGSKVKHDYSMKTQSVDLLTAESDGSDLRLDIALRRAMKMSDIKIFALKPDAKANLPHRLVIDIPSTGSALPAASSSAVKGSAEKASSKSAKYSASKDEKKILKGKVICIDPGHGGTDVGAIGTLGKKSYYEKDITMSIAEPLRDMLRAAGAKVIMTRDSDKDVSRAYAGDAEELQARCDVANRAKADAFISIHIDSFSNSSVDGTTAYYYPKSGKDLLLARALHESTMARLAIPDRGVRSNDLYVNIHTKMPSVLMEMGFISNTHRLKMLTSSWGAKSIAQSMYYGIIDYFKQIS